MFLKEKLGTAKVPFANVVSAQYVFLRLVNLTLLHFSSVYIPSFHWYLLHFSHYHKSWT